MTDLVIHGGFAGAGEVEGKSRGEIRINRGYVSGIHRNGVGSTSTLYLHFLLGRSKIFRVRRDSHSTMSAVGQRRSFDGQLCTVRYVGNVQGTAGDWLGVEWDDATRGKHSGEHKGVRYFACMFGLTVHVLLKSHS